MLDFTTSKQACIHTTQIVIIFILNYGMHIMSSTCIYQVYLYCNYQELVLNYWFKFNHTPCTFKHSELVQNVCHIEMFEY